MVVVGAFGIIRPPSYLSDYRIRMQVLLQLNTHEACYKMIMFRVWAIRVRMGTSEFSGRLPLYAELLKLNQDAVL